MKKNYQTKAAHAAPSGVAVPDTVTVAMADLAETMREGLLALAVGAGLQVMGVMMQEGVVGPVRAQGRP